MKEAIQRWNIWWDNPQSLKKYTGIERTNLPILIKTLKLPHIKDIIGIRRCGKTVLMYQIIQYLLQQNIDPETILYLNFDDPEFNDLNQTIKNALHIHPNIEYVFLDEIQQVEEWEKNIRVYYDQKKFKQLVISGSSASLISRDIGRTLTGRHMTTMMTPFSFREYLNARNLKNPTAIVNREKLIHFLDLYMKNGGYPETIDLDDLTEKSILVDLYNDILSRDIISRFDADVGIVKKIGYYLMTNISSPFSINSIARALDIHHETVKKYLSYFEEVFLFFFIPFFSWTIKAQVRKDMKCYAIDPGLRNAISFTFSEDTGKLAENIVLIELKRRGKDIYFWKDNREVDFIVKEQNQLTAINVTYTDAIKKREIQGLLEFRQKNLKTELIVITKETEREDEEGIRYIPLWKWLMENDDHQ